MTRFVGTPLTGVEFANPSDEAFSVRVLGDAHARVRIDAGGRLTWSSGLATGDVVLYRDGTNALITDDTFEASSGIITLTTNGAPSVALPDGAIAIDTTNHRFYFRSNSQWQVVEGGAIVSGTEPVSALEGSIWFNSSTSELSVYDGSDWVLISGGGGGGASVEISDTPPTSPTAGDLWFESDTGSFYVYYDGVWTEVGGGSLGYLSGLLDVSITSPSNGQVLKYNGTQWVNDSDLNDGGVAVTASDTEPVSPSSGDLWWNTLELELYVYYSSAWVQVTQNEQLISTLADLTDVSDTVPTDGQVLQFNNATAEWEPATLDLGAGNLSDLDDVTITSVSNGDFLRWNGTDWVNDAVNLSTDTIGDYVEDLTAGTGITIANSGGEASTPTISVTANTYDAFGAASSAESAANSYTDTQISSLSIPSDLDDLTDVSVPAPTVGDVLKWNGTAWVNDAIDLGTDTSGNYVSDVSAGSGITVTHTPGEGSTPTIAVTANTFDAFGSASTAESNANTYTDTQISALSIPSNLDDLTDVVLSSLTIGQVLKWNGTNWVNDTDIDTDTDTGSIITASDTAPSAPSSGDMWWDTTNLELFIYAGGVWVEVTSTPTVVETLADLTDVSDTIPTNGQVLQFNNVTAEWEPVTIDTSVASLDDIGDVDLSSPTAGDFLKWTGSKWANEPIDLGTDTTGNYVSDVVAGSGIQVTHVQGEGSSATVAIDAVLEDLNNIDLTGLAGGNVLQFSSATATWVPGSIPSINALDDIADVAAPSPAVGDLIQWNGTAWVNVASSTVGATDLDGLSDVVITLPEEFQGLSYNGTNWVNSHIPLVSYVRNAESTTITTGTCVYLFGSTGDHATVKRADNNSDTTSSKTVGVAGANIAASENGPIITRGYVDGIDLSVGYTAGDVLWLGENGAFTTTKPSAPDHLVFIGVVVRATNNGIIYVATQNGYELDELHDVSIVDKTSGDFLKYNGTLWVNDQINLGTDTVGNYVLDVSGGTGVTVTHTPSEGSTPSIAIGQAVGTADNVTFAGVTADNIQVGVTGTNEIDTSTGNLTIDSAGGTTTVDDDLIVTGNLTVSGTTTTLDTETLTIEDNIVVLNSNVTGSPTLNAGIEIERGTSTNVSLRWNETDDAWEITSDGSTYDAIATESFVSTATTIALDDLTDVDAPTPTAGDVLSWDGTAWVNDTIAGGATVSDSAPSSPSSGALWFDSDTAKTYVYYDSSWVEIGAGAGIANLFISDTAPTSPQTGEMWFKSDTAQTFTYYDSTWVELGASGMAAVISETPPSSPISGQIWFNSDSGGTYVYFGSVWIEIGAAPLNSLLNSIDAKGDLLVGTADNTVDNLTVGSNGQILVANSSTATGLEWQTPSYASTGKAIAMAIVFGG